MSVEAIRELRGLVFSVVTLVFLLYAVKTESDRKALAENQESLKIVSQWIAEMSKSDTQATRFIDAISRHKKKKKK